MALIFICSTSTLYLFAFYQDFEALCAARSREAAKQKNTEEIPDTVPGSGSGLREDYDDLEDLHEDGNYKDLNEEQNE